MAGPIDKLSEADRNKLLEDLNYMNLEEFRSFCKTHDIPYLEGC